jgi:5'-3' exonuclease
MTDSRLDRAGVRTKFDVWPEQIMDYLALIGDSIDNIPGIDKVGPKTAAKWLNEYGTLDQLVANAAASVGKVGDNLRAGPADAGAVAQARDDRLEPHARLRSRIARASRAEQGSSARAVHAPRIPSAAACRSKAALLLRRTAPRRRRGGIGGRCGSAADELRDRAHDWRICNAGSSGCNRPS